jgi:hypothetical protein
MKHAGPAALDHLEPLLRELRAAGDLKERSRGVFYRRGRAFLHFHEDPAGLFADLRAADDSFERLDVTSAEGQRGLLASVRARA